MSSNQSSTTLAVEPQPHYRLFLHPRKCTSCPNCEGDNERRKVPLYVYVSGAGFIVMLQECFVCPHCDLLIIHQRELESGLTMFAPGSTAEINRNRYLVLGTLDGPDWKRSQQGLMTIEETIKVLHEFKGVVSCGHQRQ